jgi:hypothetical protein
MAKGCLPNVVNNKPDPTRCMVAGCNKKAIYRNNATTQRGYCCEHKSYAVSRWSESTDASVTQWMVGYDKRRGGRRWAIESEDEQ